MLSNKEIFTLDLHETMNMSRTSKFQNCDVKRKKKRINEESSTADAPKETYLVTFRDHFKNLGHICCWATHFSHLNLYRAS